MVTQVTQEADVFQSAIQRLDLAARHVSIAPETIERLKRPKALLEVSIPVRMDDGTLRVFTGYRCRHDDTRGPAKGGMCMRWVVSAQRSSHRVRLSTSRVRRSNSGADVQAIARTGAIW